MCSQQFFLKETVMYIFSQFPTFLISKQMYETPDWSIEQNNLLMYNAQLSAICLVLPFFLYS